MIPREMRIVGVFALLIGLTRLMVGVSSAWANILLQEGRYRLVASVDVCGSELCATVLKGTRSERKLQLAASEWAQTLRSIGPKIPLVLTGKLKGERFTILEMPKTFRIDFGHLLDDREQVIRLGD